jgi:N,N'-diacetyllegionaminate synthase
VSKSDSGVFIVAEIGVNWDGDFELAEQMMNIAKNAGCDAVKFQAFNEELIKEHPEKERLLKTSISQENVKKIDDISKRVGIEWFCTPMFPEAIEFLDPYVKRYKIRVFDGRPLFQNKWTELLEQVTKTGKEVIISCEKDPNQTKLYQNKKIRWLYCVAKYPCSLEDLNFSNIGNFNGYSNHCPDIIAPLTSVILGARIIEVHITLDKLKDFIDNSVSFEPSELMELVEKIRKSEKIMSNIKK